WLIVISRFGKHENAMRAYGSKRVNVDRHEPIVDELHIRAANLGQFEAYWASCLSLPHVGAVDRLPIRLNGIDPEGRSGAHPKVLAAAATATAIWEHKRLNEQGRTQRKNSRGQKESRRTHQSTD